MWVTRTLLATVVMVVPVTAAWADITAFIGSTTSPTNRPARGFAVGAGILIVGFEFEYSNSTEDAEAGTPSLQTGMGNVLLQTPVAIAGLQPYVTTGAGGYREQLGSDATTHVGFNTGGGVKISLVGPLRVRIDYRVFRLNGNPRVNVVHRLYAGANLAF
ncbi:MAG TPA: hypothetical protein VIY56_19830 [Vicinamibacterales bacterium]